MKTMFSVIVLLISVGIVAQESSSEEGYGFNSIFQKVESGVFNGSVKGFVSVKNTSGKVLYSSFIDEKSQLEIVPDKNKIYDISFKNYIINSGDVSVKYTTYNRANVFKITIPDGEYQLNLIDGSCEATIKWLKYEYSETEKQELLILHFVKDVGLFPSKHRKGSPAVFVAAGSYFVFKIAKEVTDDDSKQLPVKLSYYKIADNVIVSLIVTEYSNDIINYDLSIKSLPNGHISQKGYAINPSSRLNGGVETVSDGNNGKTIIVRPYYSSFCSSEDAQPFNFYISKDKSKIKISSSRQVKYDIVKDKSILTKGNPKEAVDLFGVIPLLK